MRKALIAIMVVAVLVVGAGLAIQGPLLEPLMKRVVGQNMQADMVNELPDGLHVIVCGAGSPMPSEMAGPCLAVIAGQRLFVVDMGSGAARNLGMMRFPQGQVEAAFITHFHSDHIDGLGEFMLQRWVTGTNTSPVPVFGPRGVEDVVDGFNKAYAIDLGHRVAHHGPETVPPTGFGGVARPFDAPEMGDGVVLVDGGGVRVTAFKVEHAPVSEAVGYKFEYGGRALVITGDTKETPNIVTFAKGTDLLVSEGLSMGLIKLMQGVAEENGQANIAHIMHDIQDYHIDPKDAARLAEEAGVKHLMFYHIVPPMVIPPLEKRFLQGVDEAFSGGVTLSHDGTIISLPKGSDAVTEDSLM